VLFLVCRESRWLAVTVLQSAFGYLLVQERERRQVVAARIPQAKLLFQDDESQHLREASRVLIISLIYYLREADGRWSERTQDSCRAR